MSEKERDPIQEAKERLLRDFLTYTEVAEGYVPYNEQQETYDEFAKKSGEVTGGDVSPSTLRMALEDALYGGKRLTNYQELGGMGASAIEWSPTGSPESRYKVEIKGKKLTIHEITKDGQKKKSKGSTTWKKDEKLSTAIRRAWGK